MKETFYFPHDNNAHNDPKLMSVFMEAGLSGVGLYWILIELLHQQEDGKITKDQFENYVKWYAGKETSNKIDQLLNVYLVNKLFYLTDDGFIYSKRVLINKEYREDLSRKRSEAGKLGAEKRALNTQKQAIAKQKTTIAKQGKEKKGKENEIKENKTNKLILLEKGFEKFWGLYPRKESKKKTETCFMNLNVNVLDNLFVGLNIYLKKWKTEETERKFIPIATSWLNQERWTDEIIIESKGKKIDPKKREETKKRVLKENEKEGIERDETIRIKNLIENKIKSLSSESKEKLDKVVLENVLKKNPGMKDKVNTPFIKPLLLAERNRFVKQTFNIE